MGGLFKLPRFIHQHDRNAVPDGIGELCAARDKLLLFRIIFQRPLGQGADEDFQQFGVYGCGHGTCLSAPIGTTQPSNHTH